MHYFISLFCLNIYLKNYTLMFILINNDDLKHWLNLLIRVDEVEAALSVQFVNEGREVWCGFKGALRSFDTDRPGRQKETISFKKDFPNVNGFVSCIRENPIMPGLIAFGTYSKCIGKLSVYPLGLANVNHSKLVIFCGMIVPHHTPFFKMIIILRRGSTQLKITWVQQRQYHRA